MGTRSDMAPAIPFKAESSPTPNVAGKWDSVGNKLVYKVYSGIHSTHLVLTDNHSETVFHSSVTLSQEVSRF